MTLIWRLLFGISPGIIFSQNSLPDFCGEIQFMELEQ